VPTGSPYPGHYALVRSVVEGLRAIHADFNFNPRRLSDVARIVYAPTNEALLQAAALKRQGRIDYLVAVRQRAIHRRSGQRSSDAGDRSPDRRARVGGARVLSPDDAGARREDPGRVPCGVTPTSGNRRATRRSDRTVRVLASTIGYPQFTRLFIVVTPSNQPYLHTLQSSLSLFGDTSIMPLRKLIITHI